MDGALPAPSSLKVTPAVHQLQYFCRG